MIQEEAAVKVRMGNKVRVAAHPEEEPQEIQVQEEEHPLHQVGSKEVPIPRTTPRRSRQEEQAFQAVIHKHLQESPSLIAVQTHGLHWTDPGSLYRSSCYRPTTSHAVYWT